MRHTIQFTPKRYFFFFSINENSLCIKISCQLIYTPHVCDGDGAANNNNNNYCRCCSLLAVNIVGRVDGHTDEIRPCSKNPFFFFFFLFLSDFSILRTIICSRLYRPSGLAEQIRFQITSLCRPAVRFRTTVAVGQTVTVITRRTEDGNRTTITAALAAGTRRRFPS